MKLAHNVAVITGASGGIGHALATELAGRGYKVYGLSRSAKGEGFIPVRADVSKEDSIAEAISFVIREAGRIDLLVANAGFGISGPIEFTAEAEAKRQMDVNFFGFHNTVRAVLPHMRKQGSGKIIAISSVAGPLSIPFQAFYSASKAAVNALALALANEVRPFGIQVCAIMPGDVSTGFTQAREKGSAEEPVYGARVARSLAVMEKDERNGMTPQYVARKIRRIGEKKRVKPLYTVGRLYRLYIIANKLLPSRLVNWAVGLIYAK